MDITEITVPGELDAKTWLIIAAVGLVALLLFAALVIIVIRKIYHASGSQQVSTPFTLDDLQKMHENGQISEQEYKNLRKTIIQDL